MKRVVREKGAFDLTRRCLIPSRERMSLLSRRKGREFHTYWTENLGPKFLKAFAAGSAGKCGLGAGALALEMLSCGEQIPSPGVQVRPMPVPGCARRAAGAGRSRFASVGICAPHSLFSKRECAAPGGREKERRGSMRTLGSNLLGCFRLRSLSGAPRTLRPHLSRFK